MLVLSFFLSFSLTFCSPGEDSCLISQMIREVDEHGQPRLPMLVFGKPCDACMKTDRYWACNHNRHERSPWKSEEKEKRWAWIWRGDMTTFSTEAYGFNPPVNRKMLDPKCIAQMRAAPRRPCLVAPTLIYVALDFAEGGDDDVAIIGGYYEGDFTLVVSSTLAWVLRWWGCFCPVSL